jgi:hypothetical protein
MVRNGNNVSICIWYEMVIMYRSAYMVRNGYSTKMIFTMVRNGRYEIVPYAKSYADSTFILILHHIQINVTHKYILHVGTVKSMYLKRKKKYTCIYTYYQFY